MIFDTPYSVTSAQSIGQAEWPIAPSVRDGHLLVTRRPDPRHVSTPPSGSITDPGDANGWRPFAHRAPEQRQMLFRYRNLLEKPSRLTIAIAVTGIGVAAAASAVAITLPGGATAGAATATAYLHGAGVAPAATPHPAVQLQAKEIETARLAQQHAAVKAMRAHEARLAARAAARRAARSAAHRAAVLAAQRQARNAQQAPSTSPAPAQPSGAAPSGVWACIAQHESGGNPAENTGNGFYGLYQFTIGSWQAAGGPAGLPSNYSAAQQTAVAMRLQAMSGWGNWPVTSQECGA